MWGTTGDNSADLQTAVRHVDAQRHPHAQHGFAPRPRALYFAHDIDLRTCKRTEPAYLKGSQAAVQTSRCQVQAEHKCAFRGR